MPLIMPPKISEEPGTRVPTTAKAAGSGITVAIDDPLTTTRRVIGELAVIVDCTMDTWRQELRAIALAAAAHGDFKSAVEGYKDIGKNLGALVDNPVAPPAQHLHIHEAELREASTADLETKLAGIRARQARRHHVEEELRAIECGEAAEDAELKALLG